ncbi:M56 family metallopeptidase [Pseudotenacibaculum sp. MALMAid0570]|uniref:M56 family metallopeptidase n=1 Tax=Pseudotenacibaculum sp. MALMAid0570 TaxID=3143938 RepID=UPI0032DEBF0D
MEGYLIKSSICLAFLYLLYRIFFKNDAHHQIKRIVGLVCILFACGFLFIPLGNLLIPDTYPEIVNAIFIQGSEGVQQGLSKVITEEVTSIYLTVYFIGLIFFAFRSLLGFLTISKWYFTSIKQQKWGFTLVKVDKEIAPFTFFNALFIGNKELDEKEMKALIAHEQYHQLQYHTVDTILLELLTVFYWFNPVVWMFQKDIKTEHEYMADEEVLKKGFNALEYQQLLFQTKTGVSLPMGNHFSNTTNLKKRLYMMNKKKVKSKKSYLKAFLFFPIMGMILLFSGFLEANHNLSNDIQTFKEKQLDTIPSKKELEKEKFQFMIRNNKTVISDKPLIIVVDNGKEKMISYSYMSNLNTNKIESVHVFKGEQALKKYGEKGRNGVVLIKMKKN